jgi:acetyltransferase EpsM
MKKIILIGNGGHAKVIRDLVKKSESYQLVGYLDDAIVRKSYINEIVYDSLTNISNYYRTHHFIIAIGDNNKRQQIVHRFANIKLNYATLLHPTATIGSNVKIDQGSVIMPNTTINADTTIGKHCIINTMSCIEHDNKICDYVHIAPNATLTGNVVINQGAFIGASTTIIPNINIGKNVIVGAGSTVIKDIADNQTVYGSPATNKR